MTDRGGPPARLARCSARSATSASTWSTRGRALLLRRPPTPTLRAHDHRARPALLPRSCCAAAIGLASPTWTARWDTDDLVGADPHRRPQHAPHGRAAPRAGTRCCTAPSAWRAWCRSTTLARLPAQHRRPLRPGQRALRAVPGPDDDVLLRRTSSTPEPVARGRPGGQARPGLPRARARAATTTCWRSAPAGAAMADPRRRALRLPGDHHDDLARSSTPTRSSRCRDRRPRGPGHRAARGLPRPRPGTYDKLVSLEMIEAVGLAVLPHLLRPLLASCSRRDGLMFLQAITIDDRAYEVEKASKSFINTPHLPRRLPALAGGHPPLPGASETDMTHGVARRHHRRTTPRPSALARDASWRAPSWRPSWATTEPSGACGTLYLAYVEAGFRERRIRTCSCCSPSPSWRRAR